MQTSATTLSPTLHDWYQRGELVELNGNQLFLIDEGEKHLPVILLIHGFPTSSWDFDKVWSSLGRDHRLVALDMLGFGFSDKPNKRDYTIHKQADLFTTLLAKLGVKHYHLLAHDYGVSVAQELLARQYQAMPNEAALNQATPKANCKSCCFLNGGLFPETHQALLIQKLLLSPLGKIVNSLTGFTLFAKSFSRVFGADTQPSEHELRMFWEAINFNSGRHLFHNLITYMRDRKQHRQRWLNALIQSPIPLALINGSVDPVSGEHLVVRYQELGCRLDYLKQLHEIGHYPHCEDPDAVSSAYLEFLAAHS